ncbi:MAG: hypothetical protein BACD_02377 [Bacteroides rodentium]
MKKRTKRRTLLICWAAVMVFILALGIRAVTQEQTTAPPEEPQQAYILIHTLDGESWGFYGELTIETDEYGGQAITLDRAWIVGADHECYNPYENKEE